VQDGEALEIGDGQLFALSHPYALDGRVSTHPKEAKGFASSNAYLVAEGDEHLLIDTGLSVHEEAILAQLGSLIEPGGRLSVYPLRLGEFSGVCNVRPVAERFDVDVVYGVFGMPDPAEWSDIRPEYRPSIVEGGGGRLREVEQRQAPPVGKAFEIGSEGREIQFLAAPLKLLPTVWLYDTGTRTLFSSDSFTWLWRPTEAGPWVVEGDEDPISAEAVQDYLFASRFWWLPGADTDRIRSELATIFDEYEIEAIAPCFGCVLKGRDAIGRHYQMLDDILRRAPELPKADVATGRWER